MNANIELQRSDEIKENINGRKAYLWHRRQQRINIWARKNTPSEKFYCSDFMSSSKTLLSTVDGS